MTKENTRNKDNALYKALTRLFSGPITKRRRQLHSRERRQDIDKYRSQFNDVAGQPFKLHSRDFFQHMSTRYLSEQQRAERYADFSQMLFLPELAAALDLYAEEITTKSLFQELVKINCPNQEIKSILHEFLYNVLNIDANLFYWTRNMCKDGDFFLYLDIDEKLGIKNVIALPTREVERIEGQDLTNPNYTQYQWNSAGMTFEPWQVSHFRILGDDRYAPYGSSIFEPARRIFRQLTLLEDAMMSYRVVRSSERRVFYVDVGNIAPDEVEQYMLKFQAELRKNQIVDTTTGKVDYRYNPLSHYPFDTIELLDGSRKTFKQLSEEWSEGEEFYTWSLNEEHKPIPAKILWAGQTQQNAQFIEVELDDGQKIKTTPEHKWMLRDGTLIEAENLKIGDSLMPYYCSKNNRLKKYSNKDNFYTQIYNPLSNKRESCHKLVMEHMEGKYKWPYIVHHRNHVKFDNRPTNLQLMTQSEHMKAHKELVENLLKYAKSPEGRQKSRETLAKTRKAHNNFKEHATELWKNPEVRKKRVDKLTLKTDSSIIYYIFESLNELGSNAKNHQIINYLNENVNFIKYLKELNPDFKNGTIDSIDKQALLKQLRKNNFGSLTKVKDFYISMRVPWNILVEYCDTNLVKSRKQVYKHFNLTKQEFNRLLKNHDFDNERFDNRFLGGGYYQELEWSCKQCNKKFIGTIRDKNRKYCTHECYSKSLVGQPSKKFTKNPIINHKVVSVKLVEERCDAYGVTIDSSTRVFPTSGYNVELIEGKMAKSGVFVRNSVEDDYYIATRGQNNATRIESLAGGTYTGDIDDVKYLQNKLFAAIKIPKAYLMGGEDGGFEDRSTLAQKDVRFARTIQRLQLSVINELEKMSIVHLYTLGFRDDDLLSFKYDLANPSKIAELQELEHWRTKFDVASAATEGFFSKRWVATKIFGLSENEFIQNQREIFSDKKFDMSLESVFAGAQMEDGGFGPGASGLMGGEESFGGEGGDMEIPIEPPGGEGPEMDVPSGEEDAPSLLAQPMEPGKRNDELKPEPKKVKINTRDGSYTTPGSKGKFYSPEKYDGRQTGARKKQMQSLYSKESSKNTKRGRSSQVGKDLFGLTSLGKGIFEENDKTEGDIVVINEGLKSIVKVLEDREEFLKEEKGNNDKT